MDKEAKVGMRLDIEAAWEEWKEAERLAALWKLEVEEPEVFQALQDPFARFVGLTVYRVRKFVRLITFGKCCRI